MLQKEMQRYNNEGNRYIQGGDVVLSIEHSPLSLKTANTLLFLLSTDDLFRDEFQKYPRAALASIGYVTASDSNLPCLSVDVLASKQEFKDSAELLKRNLTPSAGLSIVFSYESGRIEQAISSSIVHQDSTPAQLLGRMPAPHENSSYLHVRPR